MSRAHPKHPNFYVVYSNGHRYYIDVLTSGNRVILLGAWQAQPELVLAAISHYQ